MNSFLRAFSAFLIVALVTLNAALFVSAAENEIRVFADGVEIRMDVPPRIINGRTMVPIRAVSEGLGFRVEWVSWAQSVQVYVGLDELPLVSMRIGETVAIINEYDHLTGGFVSVEATIDSPPVIESGRTLVPLRFVSETLGFIVDWVSSSQSVFITGGISSDSYGNNSSRSSIGNSGNDGIFDWATAIPTSQLLKNYNLNATEMKMYEALAKGVENLEMLIKTEMSMRTEADLDMFRKVRMILVAVHPEFFWLSPEIDIALLSDGTSYIMPRYTIDGKVLKMDIVNGVGNYPPNEEIAKAKSWLDARKSEIQTIADGLPVHRGMTPYELEVAVHNWMCANIKYDLSAPNKSSMNGALIDKRATCEGISGAFQYFMNQMGIECLVVYGKSLTDSEVVDVGHAWNAIKLDREWYNVDMSADINRLNSYPLPCHWHLNRTDESMVYSHDRSKTDRVNPLVVCTGTKYNYFSMIGQERIASDEAFMQVVPKVILQARNNGGKHFEFEYDPAYSDKTEILNKFYLIEYRLWSDVLFSVDERYIIGVFE